MDNGFMCSCLISSPGGDIADMLKLAQSLPRWFGRTTSPVKLGPRTIPFQFYRNVTTRPVLGRPVPDTLRETPIRCTIFDSQGNVVQTAAKIPRREFLKENLLNSRDLRHVDGPAALVPRILVHRGSILVNMCDIRVLIRKDSVMVFDSKDPSVAARLSMLVYDIQAKLGARIRQKGHVQNYEQAVLEIVLVHALSYLELEVRTVAAGISDILKSLEDRVDREMLRELLAQAKVLARTHRKCLAVRKALDDALDDDEDVRDMYLSGNSTGEATSSYNDIELLLETYYKEADELVQQTGRMVQDVSTTEDITNMMIDAKRNEILLFRLRISILTIGCTSAIFLADFYGMNLENFIEETSWGMPVVSLAILIIASAGTIYNLRTLRFARRIAIPSIHPHGDERPMMKWLESASQGPATRHIRR